MKRSITWSEFDEAVGRLVSEIERRTPLVECIVGVSRGGTIPAFRIAQLMNVRNLALVGISYSGNKRNEPDIIYIPQFESLPNRTLLVEDQIESGRSMEKAKERLVQHGHTVLCCSIFVSTNALFEPDIYINRVKESVIFPWDHKSWK